MAQRGLFGGGAKSVGRQIAVREEPRPPDPEKVDTSPEALREREAQRQQIPHVPSVVTFACTYPAIGWTESTVDLTPLAQAYPHHSELINQLLVAVELRRATLGNGCNVIRQLYSAVNDFIEFLNLPGSTNNARVRYIAEIGLDVCKGFSTYLIDKHEGKKDTPSRIYHGLESAVAAFKAAYEGNPLAGVPFAWPPGASRKSTPREGYPLEVLGKMVDACEKDIRAVIAAHSQFETYAASSEIIRGWEPTLENVMWLLKQREASGGGKKLATSAATSALLPVRLYCAAHGVTPAELIRLYTIRGTELARQGHDPSPTVLPENSSDNARCVNLMKMLIATFAHRYPVFPFGMTPEQAVGFYGRENIYAIFRKDVNSEEGSFERRFSRALTLSRPIHGILADSGKLNYLSHKYFTIETLYPFYLYILINTGWNPESLDDLLDDIDKHCEQDLLDPENYVLIQADKGKTDKPVFHRSNRHNAMGVYRLLKYIESRIKILKDTGHYIKGGLWQYIGTTAAWGQFGRYIYQADVYIFADASEAFLKRHGLEIQRADGQVEKAIQHSRIRTTYVTVREIEGMTVSQIRQDLDQADNETASRHYMSDSTSNRIKDIRIASKQDSLITQIRNYDTAIVHSASLQELRAAIENARGTARQDKVAEVANAIGTDEAGVIHMLSPAGQTYIAACKNALAPSWPGHESFVKEGRSCRYFNKCCLCNQAVIFSDALPYVARRILDLEKLKAEIGTQEWISNYAEEYGAWAEVMERWGNRQQVEEAWGQAKSGLIVLPAIMRGA